MPYSYMLDSCHDYQIRQQREVTWEQGPIRALASITLQRYLISTTSWGCPEHQFWHPLVAISWHWLWLACSGWPAGFESTCVWSSKPLLTIGMWHWSFSAIFRLNMVEVMIMKIPNVILIHFRAESRRWVLMRIWRTPCIPWRRSLGTATTTWPLLRSSPTACPNLSANDSSLARASVLRNLWTQSSQILK